MSDDSSYTVNSHTTLGLDYEQSQQDQEVRDAYEATLTPEQLEAAALRRHRKRQRLGQSPLTSPVKEEGSILHSGGPRPSAQQAGHAFRHYYGPYGPENSQVGDGTYIDHLLDSRAALDFEEYQSQSQEPDFLEETQEPEDDDDSNHELAVQLERLRNRLEIAMRERDELQDQCDELRRASQEADGERAQLREDLGRWELAATAASALTRLLTPYTT
ncbi:hypothetical protein B0H16DRAFT_1743351 [Mycena metata]|uniref:Uncharacterized protein n=1 Tax=Mycena metata TaxID=1033252 RepID=A0AAD7H645_9AGAR|nr:hypothetical protein B0H16DRAFT_1743351 [Mycena metata]